MNNIINKIYLFIINTNVTFISLVIDFTINKSLNKTLKFMQ